MKRIVTTTTVKRRDKVEVTSSTWADFPLDFENSRPVPATPSANRPLAPSHFLHSSSTCTTAATPNLPNKTTVAISEQRSGRYSGPVECRHEEGKNERGNEDSETGNSHRHQRFELAGLTTSKPSIPHDRIDSSEALDETFTSSDSSAHASFFSSASETTAISSSSSSRPSSAARLRTVSTAHGCCTAAAGNASRATSKSTKSDPSRSSNAISGLFEATPPHPWAGMKPSDAIRKISDRRLECPVDLGTPALTRFATAEGFIVDDRAADFEKYCTRLLKTIALRPSVAKVFESIGIDLSLSFKRPATRIASPAPATALSFPIDSLDATRPDLIESRSNQPRADPVEICATGHRFAGFHLDEAVFTLQQEVALSERAELMDLGSYTSDGGRIDGASAGEFEGYVRALIGTLAIIDRLEEVLWDARVDFENGERKAMARAEGKGKGRS